VSGHAGRLVIVVGPTAVGKTATALALAEALGGEVVSADSRQVYRYMDIGTAKPGPEERRRVPHHLIDVVDPGARLTLAEYQAMAYAAIDDILSRGALPLLVGGTGQYVRAVAEGWIVPRVAPNEWLRVDLLDFAGVYGAAALHARLRALDPTAATAIDWRNARRVARALEVCLEAGRPISELQRKRPPAYKMLWIGLTRPRQQIYRRIDARIQRMLEDGLLEEVRGLAGAGYGWDLPAMSGLGYAQIGAHIRGEIGLEETVAEIKRATRAFVRRQYNWFRLDDPRIHWFGLDSTPVGAVIEAVEGWLRTTGGSVRF
jgi:tRNA dimethylallyltransferase